MQCSTDEEVRSLGTPRVSGKAVSLAYFRSNQMALCLLEQHNSIKIKSIQIKTVRYSSGFVPPVARSAHHAVGKI